jgi:hypothetical protein
VRFCPDLLHFFRPCSNALNVIIQSDGEFTECLGIQRHTLLNEGNEFLPYLCIFISDLDKIRQNVATKMYIVRRKKTVLCLGS